MKTSELPIPAHFNPGQVSEIRKVSYQEIAEDAVKWASQHQIRPAANDRFQLCLVTVDVQNTFCMPGFELYVGGRSGTGAVDDTRRLCEFIYRNLHVITQIVPTMDTHQAMQIFHSIFFVNEKGEHPSPFTLISQEDIAAGRWRFNEALSDNLQKTAEYVQRHLQYYTRELRKSSKFELTVWPYHAMLGGIGHALVPSVEEAIFFHTVARYSQPDIQMKGEHPLTEHYSVLGPEVTADADDNPLVQKNEGLFRKLIEFDAVIIAGQAKSHCVAWTIADLLDNIMFVDKSLVKKVYLLEDCSTPVVIPGVIDYTEEANEAFERFKDAGMNVVKSTESLQNWPGVIRQLAG